MPSLTNKIYISNEALSKPENIDNHIYVFTVGFMYFKALLFMKKLNISKISNNGSSESSMNGLTENDGNFNDKVTVGMKLGKAENLAVVGYIM